jgi:hypothetical protein
MDGKRYTMPISIIDAGKNHINFRQSYFKAEKLAGIEALQNDEGLVHLKENIAILSGYASSKASKQSQNLTELQEMGDSTTIVGDFNISL